MFPEFFSSSISYVRSEAIIKPPKEVLKLILPPLDTVAYDKKLNELANNPPPKPPTTKIIKDPKTGVETTITIDPKPVPPSGWPVKTTYPNAGAILPFSRIVAYYGNLYSKKMGVLGEYEEKEMLQKLEIEVKKWEEADPATAVVPALHYIAVVAQGSAGKDGKYRARMPDSEIDKVLTMAKKINAIVFLDIQVGFSTIEIELPHFEKYLKLPNVHVGVDPEFSMKSDIRPGKVVGTYDATDINFVADYLAKLVRDNNLTPKILIVHRYTQKMLTNYQNIKPLPEVQIVMHMDGWGGKAKKINTYQQFVYKEPVQFTGFKLFYKNDILDSGTVLFTPKELLKLSPKPIYIQYQ
ncbi:MAG: hypothetical protein AAB786_02170 [Patescibacteria group bacterium]